MRILIVEDDATTLDFVAQGLREHGHVVQTASDGREGLLAAAAGPFDALVLDRMLPSLDGLAIVKVLRAAKVQTPILILTTMSGIDDRVEGLEAGADDYLVKPFAFAECLARIHALGRRLPPSMPETILREGDLEMDLVARTVRRGGILIALLPREYQLLEVLLRNSGGIVTRTMLLERVWNYQFDPRTSIVETHMSRLRAKVDKDFAAEMIRTIRGSGYTLSARPS